MRTGLLVFSNFSNTQVKSTSVSFRWVGMQFNHAGVLEMTRMFPNKKNNYRASYSIFLVFNYN